ncbi:MAG: amino acid permease [Pseudomonadales bacterium]|nr:amino acid permease [Pseudomonadales bacterium]
MIGTGVFTSLGFQLVDIRSGFALLLLWAVGGLAALCGAISYAELGATYPRSGGEYNFLTRIYHPAAGFVSGWISAAVGFAAPTALAAMTFAAYFTTSLFGDVSATVERLFAIVLLVVLAAVHGTNHRYSGGTQVIFTALKIVVILVFIFATLLVVDSPQPVVFSPIEGDLSVVTSGTFAVALTYVNFAYSGWNAATYLSSEIENPQRTLPWVLITGTSIVTLLYLALNFSFLYTAPMDAMVGEVEVGAIAAQAAFGEVAGGVFGVALALLLISTVSAMTMAGPRVIQVIGEDFPRLRSLGKVNADGIPTTAIYLQSSIAVLFILSSTFESILVFAGFTMALNTFVTVLGLFYTRWKNPELERPYKTFLYPLPPIIFLALTGWTLSFTLIMRPVEGLFSLGVIASGLVFYFLTSQKSVS